MRKTRKILVCGGTGLLGTGFKSVADEYPDLEIVLAGSRDCNLLLLEDTVRFVGRHAPDVLIDLAAVLGGVQFSSRFPATMLRDNLLMNINVLEAARLNKVKKVVMTLSTGMYPGDAPNPLKEEYIHNGSPHESNYSYSFAKRMIDPSIKAYRTEYGLNAIGLVPNGIFGENMNFRPDESFMLAGLIRRFYENRNGRDKIVTWGDGTPLREYTYSKDMARAFLWCLENYDDAQILHVGSTEEHSVKEIAYMVADIMGIEKSRVTFDSSKPAGIFKKSTDNSRFVSLSGFQYTPFRLGLETTIRWFCENYDKPGVVRL